MTDNPFQPPSADVRDTPPRRLVAERPRQIVQALALLWLSTGLGLVAGASEVQNGPDPQTAMAFMVLTMLLVVGVLTVALWRGRNWARVLYVVLVATSLASFLSSWGIAERPALAVAFEAVSFVADAGSFFLMFTRPGSLWFQNASEGSASQ